MPAALSAAVLQRADQVVAAVAQPQRQVQAPADGIFLLVVHVASQERAAEPPRPLNVTVHIEMRADYGYLSAADWPNLPVRPGGGGGEGTVPPHTADAVCQGRQT